MMNADRRLRAPLVLGWVSTVLVFAACSSEKPGFESADRPPFTPPDAGSPSSPTCKVHCSRDLKQVLTTCEDGVDRVSEQCSEGQGCGNGTCTDACTAAALNKGSAGCDFWTLPPDDPISFKGACFAAMLANTWDRPVHITAGYGSETLDISKSIYTVERVDEEAVHTPLTGPLPPGGVAIVFLAHNEATPSSSTYHCPEGVTPAMLVDPLRHGSGRTAAFHLSADAPIAAYSVYPYGGAASMYPTATLLLPVSSWEKDYVAVAPYDFADIGWPRTLQIVGQDDGTNVQMTPTVQVLSASGVEGTAPGVPKTWTLKRGEVLQFTQRDLTGSAIKSDKPVGVFGGTLCTELPGRACDILQQQIAPFGQWGTEYAFVPFRPRIESFSGAPVPEKVPYSMVGGADGTELTYEPSRPRGAPETLRAGEVAQFYTDEIFVVRSQDAKHPFYAAVYMTGAEYGNGTGKLTFGDPDFVNLSPTAQYLDRYVFFADFTYPDTALTLVRKKTKTGFAPVELDCGGEVSGWQRIDADGNYEFAWVALTKSYIPQKFPKGECGYGRIEAHSSGPFGITVWGIGSYASYGYVGGTGLRTINEAKPIIVN